MKHVAWPLRGLSGLLVVFGALAAQAAPVYQVTDLGTLGGPESIPTSLNRLGWVAGYSNTGDDRYRAFLWLGGCMTSLGALRSDGDSFATGVNLAGQASGFASAPDGSTHAVLFSGGQVQDLGALRPGWLSSTADAINRSGHVVGTALDGSTYQFRGFTYANGRIRMLPEGSRPRAINDRDQVTGAIGSLAFLSEGDAVTNLGTLGGSWSEGLALNRAGQVTGWAATAGDSTAQAFVWQSGAMTDLGTLGGWQSQGRGINRQGTVVGWSFRKVLSGKHAFRTVKGKMVDLNRLLDPASGAAWELLEASAIDDTGRIVGFGVHNGAYHGFLLSPVVP
jgi:probable HAF family extracellular repeat protein